MAQCEIHSVTGDVENASLQGAAKLDSQASFVLSECKCVVMRATERDKVNRQKGGHLRDQRFRCKRLVG